MPRRGRPIFVHNVHRNPPEGIGYADLSDECKESIQEQVEDGLDTITDQEGVEMSDDVFGVEHI